MLYRNEGSQLIPSLLAGKIFINFLSSANFFLQNSLFPKIFFQKYQLIVSFRSRPGPKFCRA